MSCLHMCVARMYCLCKLIADETRQFINVMHVNEASQDTLSNM